MQQPACCAHPAGLTPPCCPPTDVADYQGRGESCPLPYFFQNLGEAEYLVSVRLLVVWAYRCLCHCTGCHHECIC